MRNFIQNVRASLRRRYRYFKNELWYVCHGDDRDEFEKRVQKCRILELTDIIESVAGIPEGGT